MKWIKVPKREKVEQKERQRKKNPKADSPKCFKLTNLFKINITDARCAMQNPAASIMLVPSCSDNSPPAPNREDAGARRGS